MNYEKLALAVGFDHAAVMPVSELVIVPEYRKYCEMNYCGNYDKVASCPSHCGTVAQMLAKMIVYNSALVMQSTHEVDNVFDRKEQNKLEAKHNIMTEAVHKLMKEDGIKDSLFMSAGPWKGNSCLSAYCINAQKMAEYVNMDCWLDDGKSRFFSLILF